MNTPFKNNTPTGSSDYVDRPSWDPEMQTIIEEIAYDPSDVSDLGNIYEKSAAETLNDLYLDLRPKLFTEDSDFDLEEELDCPIFKDLTNRKFEEASQKLKVFSGEADRSEICWVEVEHNVFWPAQRVTVKENLKQDNRVQEAIVSRKGDEDECFMFFALEKVRFVNSSVAIKKWKDGLRDDFAVLRIGLFERLFKTSVTHAFRSCTFPHYYTDGWWNEPEWQILFKKLKEVLPHIDEIKENRVTVKA